MASALSILLTIVLHLLGGTSIFVHQMGEICTEAPLLASLLVYLSLMSIFYDIQLIPPHWSHMPGFLKLLIEFCLIVLLTEVGMVLLWGNVELFTEDLLKSVCKSESAVRIYLAVLLTFLSGSIFLLVSFKTNSSKKLKELFEQVSLKLNAIKQPTTEKQKFPEIPTNYN
ncbi:uncharacterized protein LOC133850568 [Drosophila sulfurigaster albostrigata]|uniref:uncharacterized protein LOC133850568 n=1 Tax=Drosophila sulfurigaster albostrigata TaxID=89887 RepID=UPI002D21D991|nr:uncharacterized protein LOC133850568 [Drosophila sulfurigaster albostrigata]